MNVHGAFRFAAPPDRVFGAVCDPRVLLEVIPGCEAVEQTSPTEYVGRIRVRLPGAVGRYRTSVRLVDPLPPQRTRLDGRVEGPMGTIDGHADLRFTAVPGGTDLAWDGSGTIQGPLARLDSRFAERLAESLIAQGLRSLATRLATEGSE